MPTLSLKVRRTLGETYAEETAAVADIHGAPLKLFRETKDSWRFVVPQVMFDPAELDGEPRNDRELLENAVYRLFIEDPALVDEAIRHPALLSSNLVGRLPEDFMFFVASENSIQIYREQPGEIAIVAPYAQRQFRLGVTDELSDEALDLVSGGGKHPCNTDDSRFIAQEAQRSTDGGVGNSIG